MHSEDRRQADQYRRDPWHSGLPEGDRGPHNSCYPAERPKDPDQRSSSPADNRIVGELVELARDAHPWFLGCQFHPEYKSKPLAPHPLFASFVRAAHRNRMRDETAVSGEAGAEAAPHERAQVLAGDD